MSTCQLPSNPTGRFLGIPGLLLPRTCLLPPWLRSPLCPRRPERMGAGVSWWPPLSQWQRDARHPCWGGRGVFRTRLVQELHRAGSSTPPPPWVLLVIGPWPQTQLRVCSRDLPKKVGGRGRLDKQSLGWGLELVPHWPDLRRVIGPRHTKPWLLSPSPQECLERVWVVGLPWDHGSGWSWLAPGCLSLRLSAARWQPEAQRGDTLSGGPDSSLETRLGCPSPRT